MLMSHQSRQYCIGMPNEAAVASIDISDFIHKRVAVASGMGD